MELVVQFPARGSTQVLLCLFPGVLWLWHFLYSVGPHPVSSLHVYTFVVSRAFIAGAASQAGDADSSRAPGLTSGLQGSVIVHRGALLLVPQWRCISSFVFYIVHKGWGSKTFWQMRKRCTRRSFRTAMSAHDMVTNCMSHFFTPPCIYKLVSVQGHTYKVCECPSKSQYYKHWQEQYATKA